MLVFFFFNDTATTEIYTLSLHDALPILERFQVIRGRVTRRLQNPASVLGTARQSEQRRLKQVHVGLVRSEIDRSEEHTSELQSRLHLVCRLLLEKKKTQTNLLTLRLTKS